MPDKFSHRWLSSSSADVDAYLLTDGSWYLFAYFSEERLKGDVRHWRGLAAEFPHGRVAAVGRAFKSPRQSEALDAVAASPGTEVPREIWCREGWLRLRLETSAVLNPGLFLDQAANRRELGGRIQSFVEERRGQLGEDDGVLNLFSYTGAFSMAAFGAGARRVTSVDVSRRYQTWERENFQANFGGHAVEHRLVPEDGRDYLRRCVKRGARFRWIIIDPPTFSRGDGKIFRVRDDLAPMVEDASRCLAPGGSILASCNDAEWMASAFHGELRGIAERCGLRSAQGAPEPGFPPDHPLKSAWLSAG